MTLHKEDIHYTAFAPGNLLICGEYAILEEGGMGLAVATLPCAQGSARVLNTRANAQSNAESGARSSASTITVISGTERTIIDCFNNYSSGYSDVRAQQQPTPPHFIRRVFESIAQRLEQSDLEIPALSIEIDSRNLYSNGRKLGYGSSACSAVILCALVFAASKGVSAKDSTQYADIISASFAAHFRAQGNRGSGYDILSSCSGGIGIFTGARSLPPTEPQRPVESAIPPSPTSAQTLSPKTPQWKALIADHPLQSMNMSTFRGGGETDSRQAIARYTEWKLQCPNDARAFFSESQYLMNRLIESTEEAEVLRTVQELGELSRRLGDAIRVSSRIDPPLGLHKHNVYKSCGAGNEIGIIIRPSDSVGNVPESCTPLIISQEGLRVVDTAANIDFVGAVNDRSGERGIF